MKVHLSVILLLFASEIFAQTVYTKLPGETNHDFVYRTFPQMENNAKHAVISGKWGDTRGEKIFFAYDDEENAMVHIVVLTQDSANHYSMMDITEEYWYIGSYRASYHILSVFFYDYDKDGYKELVLVEVGVQRCEVELEEYDEETGELQKYTTMASCDAFAYTVLGQKKVDGKFVNYIEQVYQDYASNNLDQASAQVNGSEWNAAKVKEILNSKK